MCGISGFNGKNAPNIEKIKILAILNTSRGKDSCGIAINNYLVKGHKKVGVLDTSNAIDFLTQIYLSSIKKFSNTTTLFHTRQGTKGAATGANAHPFGYLKDPVANKSFNEGNPDKLFPEFVLMMNGTLDDLYHVDAPHKKYGKTYTYDMNDSKMLGEIIFENGFKYLEEYKGGAALAFYWANEPNTLWLWKGATLNGSVMTEERPLSYYYDKKDKGIYFSSLSEHLAVIAEGAEIMDVPVNTLLKFHNGEIVESIEVNRKVSKYTYQAQNNYQTQEDYQLGFGYGVQYNNNKKKHALPSATTSAIKTNTKYVNGMYQSDGGTLKTGKVQIAAGLDATIMVKKGIIVKGFNSVEPSEEFISIKDNKLVDYKGRVLLSWERHGTRKISYVLLSDKSYIVDPNGVILSTNIINNYDEESSFWGKYGFSKYIFDDFKKAVANIIEVPARIVSPYGYKVYLQDNYNILIDMWSINSRKDIEEALKGLKPNIEDSQKKEVKVVLGTLIEKILTVLDLKELMAFLGDSSESIPTVWFQKRFGSTPDFSKTIQENIENSELAKKLAKFFDTEIDLVEYLSNSDYPEWMVDLTEFKKMVTEDEVVIDKDLKVFNENHGTTFKLREDAEASYLDLYRVPYDWAVSPEENELVLDSFYKNNKINEI